MDEIHDTSRLDAYMRSRQRVALLNAVWRPMLAGAAGAALVIAAVWVTLPKLSYRDVEIPRVSYKDAEVPRIVPHDVTVDHVIPHDVPIDIPIPRLVPAAPEASAAAPRTPEERRFEDGKDWQSSTIRGRIVREEPPNGFVLATDEGETAFFPARLGPEGRPQNNSAVRVSVRPFLGDLGYCSPLPVGTYHCVALHAGVETQIPQIPVGGTAARPLTGEKPAFASGMILVRLEARR
jgi:hypothetical protein